MANLFKVLKESEVDNVLEYGHLNGNFFGGYI